MKKQFERGQRLAAADLQDMANSIEALEAGLGKVVTGRRERRGGRAPLACFNVTAEQVAEAAAAEVAVDENTMDVAGLIWGVEYTADVSAPRINMGLIQLPAGTGGGGGCNCVAAQYDEVDMPVGVLGHVCGVGFDAEADRCRIENGNIRLPLCEQPDEWEGCDGCVGSVAGGVRGARWDDEHDCPSVRGGVVCIPRRGGGEGPVGVVTVGGENVSWAAMEGTAVDLAVLFLDGYRLYLTGEMQGGFLKFDTRAV